MKRPAGILQQDLDCGQTALRSKKLLSPSNVHCGKTRMRRRRRLLGGHQSSHRQLASGGVHQHPEPVSELQPPFLSKLLAQGQRSRVFKPLRPLLPGLLDPNGAKSFVGEQVHPKDVEIVTRELRQGHHPLHQGGRCADPRLRADLRPEHLVHFTAHLPVCLSRHNIHGSRERAVGACVGNLDGQIDGHPQGNAQNIEQSHQPVRREIPHALPEEKGEEARGHKAWPARIRPANHGLKEQPPPNASARHPSMPSANAPDSLRP